MLKVWVVFWGGWVWCNPQFGKFSQKNSCLTLLAWGFLLGGPGGVTLFIDSLATLRENGGTQVVREMSPELVRIRPLWHLLVVFLRVRVTPAASKELRSYSKARSPTAPKKLHTLKFETCPLKLHPFPRPLTERSGKFLELIRGNAYSNVPRAILGCPRKLGAMLSKWVLTYL